MPVAVPTGSYEVRCSLDLSPLFGRIEHREMVALERPAADLLARRLAELASGDVNVRRRAIIDLRYFPRDGKEVVPALVALLDEEDPSIRMLALSVLAAFPVQAAEHVDRFLEIAAGKGEEPMEVYERGSAVHLLGLVAPESEEVERALQKAAASENESLRQRAERALKAYRARHAPEEAGKD